MFHLSESNDNRFSVFWKARAETGSRFFEAAKVFRLYRYCLTLGLMAGGGYSNVDRA